MNLRLFVVITMLLAFGTPILAKAVDVTRAPVCDVAIDYIGTTPTMPTPGGTFDLVIIVSQAAFLPPDGDIGATIFMSAGKTGFTETVVLDPLDFEDNESVVIEVKDMVFPTDGYVRFLVSLTGSTDRDMYNRPAHPESRPYKNNTKSSAFLLSTTVLLQNTNGRSGYWILDQTGRPSEWKGISDPISDWTVRDIDENRVLLQNERTGAAGIWQLDDDGNPTNWFFVSGPLPGWIMRSLDGNKVLLQQGDGGAIGIWTINEDGSPIHWQLVSGALPGWSAQSLHGDFVLLQRGEGGPIGIWELENGKPAKWQKVSGPIADWSAKSLDGNCILLQDSYGSCGMWELDVNSKPSSWIGISVGIPGWSVLALD
jgi:hypothetical protein